MDGSGNNIDQSIIRISTPLSDAGESTSEMCNSLPNIMSKAQQQHEAIFGRPGSTDNHRAKIVAYEEDLEYSQSSTGRNINNRTPQTSNTPAKINSNIPTQQHQSSNNNAMSGLINGRSPRLMPTHHHHHNMPPTHIGGQQEPASAAPTALMIMQRRRRSNSGDALRNSSSKMKNNHELNLSTSNKGKSPKVTSSNGSPPKDGTNVLSSTSEEQQDLDATAKNKNEEHPKQLNIYESAIQQQNELYNSVLSANATQQQPQQTAMRYNASLHSTLGGYPMGLPTQLTHPSVTMELIARDRARWEADYYTSGGGGLGMNDYGGGNSVSSYGANPSFRGMSSSAANSNIMQQQQQPHMTPQGSGDQQQSQTTTQMGMGDTNMKIGQQPQQQQFYQPASHLHQSPTRQQGVLPAPASPHRNNRVFQERDYKNDRVWQEDDHHTRTTVDPTASSPKPERRHTEQTSNREMDKKTHLAAEGVVESAQLPPVPHLRDGGANNGVPSTQQPQQVNITQGRPQVLPLSHQVPQRRDEGRFSMEEHAYHHSTAVAGMVPPAYNMHQAGVPPPTAVRPTRERELSDISMMAGSVGGGPMLLPVVYPNGTYGLIQYPPTPGSLVGHPTAAMHPGAYHVDPRQQGNMPWLNPNLVYQNIPRHSSDYDVSYAASNPAEETSHSNMKISSSRKNDKQNNDGNSRVLRHSAPEHLEAPAAKSNSNLPRIVSFSHLEIRTYETILCENPSCSGGPSLGLGWRYDPNHDCITVDEYEAHQAQIHGLPTGEYYVCRPEDLVLHRFEREAILLNTGYSRQDLADSVRSMNKVKNKRRQTVHNLPVAYFEEKVEVVNRILRRWMRKRERSSHMYEDWKKKTAQGKV